MCAGASKHQKCQLRRRKNRQKIGERPANVRKVLYKITQMRRGTLSKRSPPKSFIVSKMMRLDVCWGQQTSKVPTRETQKSTKNRRAPSEHEKVLYKNTHMRRGTFSKKSSRNLLFFSKMMRLVASKHQKCQLRKRKNQQRIDERPMGGKTSSTKVHKCGAVRFRKNLI